MNTQIIQDDIQKTIDDYYTRFQERMKEIKEPEVIEFVEKYIEWYNNNSLYCYQMFREVINQDSLSFFGNLEGFIVNYFYDDSYFSIKWYVNKFNENREMIQVECDKDSSIFAQPKVVWGDDDDNVTQDPKVLLDAMKEKEEQERRQKEYFKRF